jgi:hypothetical protein
MLVPMGLGGLALNLNGLDGMRMMQNVWGWALGIFCYLGITKIGVRSDNYPMMAASLITVCALPFLESGQQGVYRWIQLGPLSANIAAMLLPAIICLLVHAGNKLLLPLLLALNAILAMQPDLSQLLGLALAAIVIALHRPGRVSLAVGLLSCAALAIAMGRPDPLLPIPAVEGIVGLGFEASSILGMAIVAALALCAVMPWLCAPRTQSAVLSAYIIGITVAPMFGAYPVPYAGLGVSFPIGLWLALGLIRLDQLPVKTA